MRTQCWRLSVVIGLGLSGAIATTPPFTLAQVVADPSLGTTVIPIAPPDTDPATLDGNKRVDINASGRISGIITLPDVSFLQNSLTEFPQTFTDTTQILANSCIVRSGKQNGRFVITGSGGLPQRPGDAPVSPFPTGEVRSVSEVRGEERGERGQKDTENPGSIQNSSLKTQNSPDRPWKIGDPIVEPQGVYKLANGDLVISRECK